MLVVVSIPEVIRVLFQALLLMILTSYVASAAEQRIIKVLPHFMDKQGRHAQSPSLFERDAYQKWLRENPNEQSGIRYDIQWQSYISGEYTLKLELLGRVEKGRAQTKTVDIALNVKNSRRHWDSIKFVGADYKKFGQIVAWRVSIWQGGKMLGKQQSFLWE